MTERTHRALSLVMSSRQTFSRSGSLLHDKLSAVLYIDATRRLADATTAEIVDGSVFNMLFAILQPFDAQGGIVVVDALERHRDCRADGDVEDERCHSLLAGGLLVAQGLADGVLRAVGALAGVLAESEHERRGIEL